MVVLLESIYPIPNLQVRQTAERSAASMATIEGTVGDDTLTGTSGTDTLNGFDGDDTLDGLAGDDTLEGGSGMDELDGGDGMDWALYTDSAAGVTIDLSAPDADGYVNGTGGDAEGDKLKNIENLWGSEHADHLTGDDNHNALLGFGGDDRLYGGGGDDGLQGGAGTDVLDGGAGEDWAFYSFSTAGVTIDLAAPDADGYVNGTGGHAEGDKLKNIENLQGSVYADHLTGDGRDNRLRGDAGGDILDGGAGEDWALYPDSKAGVTIDLSAPDADSYANGAGGDAQGDKLKNIENLWGSEHADHLTGDGNNNNLGGLGGDDTLYGNSGADTLNGGEGNDHLHGGAGADVLIGGPGDDYAYYLDSNRGVLVRLHDARAVRFGDAEGDTLTGIEHLVGSEYNDTLAGDGEDNILEGRNGDDVLYGGPAGGDDRMSGGNGDDRIFGGRGNDVLTGGEGNDVLKGGPGEDTLIADGDDLDVLYGGPDSDTFRFFPSDLGGGSIRDFSDGEDVIDLTEFTGVNSMDDLDIVSHGDNVQIEVSGADYLTIIILSDFDVGNLDNSDFPVLGIKR